MLCMEIYRHISKIKIHGELTQIFMHFSAFRSVSFMSLLITMQNASFGCVLEGKEVGGSMNRLTGSELM